MSLTVIEVPSNGCNLPFVQIPGGAGTRPKFG